MSPTIYSSPLLNRVALLVKERPRSMRLDDLAGTVGCTRQWLSMFAHGRMENPSAVVIERLYVTLTGKQLINDEL